MFKKLTLAIVMAVLAIAPAKAQEAPSPKAMVVDVQKILKESSAAKSIRQQIDAQREKFQTEIAADEKKLKDEQQALVKGKDKMTAEARKQKEEELRTHLRTVERKVAQRRRALDQGLATAMREVRNALAAIVPELAKERGANLVMPKSDTMWHEPALEATDEVLKRMNAKLPTVTVTVATTADTKAK